MRAPLRTALVRLIAALAGIWLPSPAVAFRCAQSDTQVGPAPAPALSWARRNLTFTLQADGTAQLPVADTQAILRAAFVVWQGLTLAPDAAAQCGHDAAATDITFTEMPSSPMRWVGYNFSDPNANMNLIMFEDENWQATPGSVDIVALTTTTYSALTGEIFDADIAFNSANFQFVTANPSDAQLDLLSAAVHEIGHFLGLAHCTDDASASCGHGEVMEPEAAFGTVAKRQLQCDDRAAIAFRYPAGAATGACGTEATAAGADPACPSGCQPPTLPTRVAAIVESGSDMGRGCQSAPTGPAAVLTGVAGVRLARRRRRPPVRQGARPHRAARRAPWLVLGALGVLLAATGACQTDACPGSAASVAPDAPRILHMALVEQVPHDPWRVVLACDFIDPDGDLGRGVGIFRLTDDAESPQRFALADSFAATSGLPVTATAGRLQLLARFAPGTASGSVVHLCTQLVDAAGHASNNYRLDLRIDLDAVSPIAF